MILDAENVNIVLNLLRFLIVVNLVHKKNEKEFLRNFLRPLLMTKL